MVTTGAPDRRVSPWEVLALLAIIALATWVRLDDLDAYRGDTANHFADGEPLLLNPDGYYFLSLARDLAEGSYTPVDPLRGAPMGTARPAPPPPLALLTVATSRITGLPLGWVAALLPAFLGPLLALPVFAVGRRLTGPVGGLAAALVAVLSHYYVYRTTVGFHDTDALNVTLAMSLAWWGLVLASTPRDRFARWLLAGTGLFGMYLWWWQGAYSVVTLMGVWTLACAMALRPPDGRERLLAAAVVALAGSAAMLVSGPRAAARFMEHLAALVSHVSKAPTGDFPNVAASIGEQVPATLAQAAGMTTGDPILLGVAMAGLLVLLLRQPAAALVILPILALAMAGCLYAQRFLIFAAPLSGLGIGFFAAQGIAAARDNRGLQGAVVIGVLAVAAPSLHRGFSIDFTPTLGGDLVAAMQWLAENAPDDAVVWGSWDHGYGLRYWSRRATVNDGSVHTGEITVYTALPFAAPDFRLAANFMQFYSVHGQPGMQRIHRLAGSTAGGLALARRVFGAGPREAHAILQRPLSGTGSDEPVETWIEFLFPAQAPPLYLLMDQRMLRSARWWHEYGTWNATSAQEQPARMQPFAGLSRNRDRITGPRIQVDLGSGTAALEGRGTVELSRVVTATTRGVRERRYPRAGPEFHLHALDGVGVLQDPELARTVFSRAFVLRAADPGHFHAQRVWGTRAQVWRVRGDAHHADR